MSRKKGGRRPESDGGTILSRALPRAGRTVRLLLKMILPISFGVGLLRYTGLLERIGQLCAPAMAFLRLPGEAAVALVSGLLAGIYALAGAMTVLNLTPAELTVLCATALVAHNLIVECTVQHRAGTPWWWMLGVRLLFGALVGATVAWSVAGLQWLHVPALWLRFVPTAASPTLAQGGDFHAFLIGWLNDTARLVLKLVIIVTGMMVVTEWIRSSGTMARLEATCRPALRFLGLADAVAYLWLTAQILGVAYGAGLLIEETREEGRYRREDVRALNSSIGISHSLFEDTVVLASLGASLVWIIVPRILFAALAVRLLRPLRLGLRRPAVPAVPAEGSRSPGSAGV